MGRHVLTALMRNAVTRYTWLALPPDKLGMHPTEPTYPKAQGHDPTFNSNPTTQHRPTASEGLGN